MTNERACANGQSMTRGQMQAEAHIIESLLNAVMAMSGQECQEQIWNMVEMAHGRASQLNRALDIVNAVEVSV